MNIIAITACPTGVAHTYLAESNLKKAARKLGLSLRVETQGAIESQYILSAEDIAAADIVLIAADKRVEMGRFQHKNIIEVPVARAARDAEGLLNAITGGELVPHRLETLSEEPVPGRSRQQFAALLSLCPFDYRGEPDDPVCGGRRDTDRAQLLFWHYCSQAGGRQF
ncbi:fructose-specific phosphotransferase system IIB component [Erwinia aphidicola]